MGIVKKVKFKVAKVKVRRKRKAYEKEALQIKKETVRTHKALKEAKQHEELTQAIAKRKRAEAREAKARRASAEKRKKKGQSVLSSLRKGFRKTQRKLGY